MSKNTFYVLLCLCVVLGVVLFVAESDQGGDSETARGPLFKDVDAGAVAALKIEQGNDSTMLELNDGSWTVPARGGYPADYAKIRSLLLKLLDLNVSQSVTENEERYAVLGVTEETAKNGNGVVTFLDQKKAVLFGALLGTFRKGSAKMSAMPGQGQYVRRLGDKTVYLISDPITVSSSVKSWLSTSILNILQSALASIRQSRLSSDGEKPEFLLVREGSATPQQKFSLSEPAAKAGAVVEPEVALIRSGLENLALSDVYKADDPQVKDVSFDFVTSYTLEDGLVYRVLSAPKPGSADTFLIKLSAVFDSQAAERSAKEAIARAEEAKKAQEAAAKTSETNKPDEATPPPAAQPEFKASSAQEAAKVSSRFEPWVYEVAGYQGKKFRVTLESLTKPESQ